MKKEKEPTKSKKTTKPKASTKSKVSTKSKKTTKPKVSAKPKKATKPTEPTESKKTTKSTKSKKRNIIIVACIFAAALLIAGAFAIEQYYRLEVCNFSANDDESHGYYVYPDMTLDSLIYLMQADYTIGSYTDWRIHRRQYMHGEPQTGYYKFPARIGDKHLIVRLQLGQQTPFRLTFTNAVRTREQLAGRMGKALLLDSTEIIARLDSVEYLKRFGLNKETAVCLFIPDTYEVYWTITPDQLFERMYREYQTFWNSERLRKADSLGLTPVEVATLASIVESETHNEKEYPIIASLYLNRLRKGMALQACPTVIFATGDLKMRRVLKRHLRIDSPYNTYIHRGLPPGPIRCAMGSTMDAVLNAPETDYLYMCANPDWSGTHIFSANYSVHAEAAKAYQQELDARQIH